MSETETKAQWGVLGDRIQDEPRETWRVFPNILTEYELKAILAHASKLDMKTGKVFKKGGGQGTVPIDGRVSQVGWLTGNHEVENILWKYVSEANKSFGINVLKKSEIQYTEYHGYEKGHYDTHSDTNWEGNTLFDRKLSVTVQLSDRDEYVGGKFDMIDGLDISEEISKGIGTVVIFPSYLRHRVNPVTSGCRKTLVAWFHGPRWR